MSYGNYRNKTEGGSGGKRGHSNQNHHDYTETIKEFSKKSRRQNSRDIERKFKYRQFEEED